MCITCMPADSLLPELFPGYSHLGFLTLSRAAIFPSNAPEGDMFHIEGLHTCAICTDLRGESHVLLLVATAWGQGCCIEKTTHFVSD